MAANSILQDARTRIGERIADIEARMPRLAPRAIHRRMDAIRTMAAAHGLLALEGLADYGAHHAMLPGCKAATRACLDHMRAAMDGQSPADREAVLASLAMRIH